MFSEAAEIAASKNTSDINPKFSLASCDYLHRKEQRGLLSER